MTDIIIPPAALEAGARALCNEQRLFWPDLTKDEHDIIRGEARAACIAILQAWPGMEYVFRQPTRYSVCYSKPAIILPLLPQEASDDQ